MSRVHIGTMGWSYKFWVGNFYPAGTTSDKYLLEYSKHFNTVEVDNTFYRIPYQTAVMNWRDHTPDDFLFSPKFPRAITHDKLLRHCEEIVGRFIERISDLQNKLGPMLIQLPPEFNLDHVQTLSDFIAALPKEYRYVVEVRNKGLVNDELYSLLRKNEIALAFVDHPFLPRIDTVTADFAYIRLEGDRRNVKGTLGKAERDRTNDLEQWADTTKSLLSLNQEVFIYVSKYYSGHPPTDAVNLSRFLARN
jgi:uncharacterized protein YecE (DUF72 family)